MFAHGIGIFGGWPGMLVMWLVPVLALIAIFKYFSTSSQSSGTPRTPLEILEEAYARGEVTREDFLQRRDDLQQK